MESAELKRRREQLGLTQAELAEVLGVAENTIWRYEKGSNRNPKTHEFNFGSIGGQTDQKAAKLD